MEGEKYRGDAPGESLEAKKEELGKHALVMELLDFAAAPYLSAGIDVGESKEQNPEDSTEATSLAVDRELPVQFQPLISDYTGKYYISNYEEFDRPSADKKGTVHYRTVWLSDIKAEEEDDARRHRKITFTINDAAPSEVEMGVKEFNDGEVEAGGRSSKVKGSALFDYKLNDDGSKALIFASISRSNWGVPVKYEGHEYNAAWHRNLHLGGKSRVAPNDIYYSEDLGVINIRNSTVAPSMAIFLQGSVDHPKSIKVLFGRVGPDRDDQVLYEDKESDIYIAAERAEEGYYGTTKKRALDILKSIPDYQFLFDNSPDKETQILAFLKARIAFLMIPDQGKGDRASLGESSTTVPKSQSWLSRWLKRKE